MKDRPYKWRWSPDHRRVDPGPAVPEAPVARWSLSDADMALGGRDRPDPGRSWHLKQSGEHCPGQLLPTSKMLYEDDEDVVRCTVMACLRCGRIDDLEQRKREAAATAASRKAERAEIQRFEDANAGWQDRWRARQGAQRMTPQPRAGGGDGDGDGGT